MLRTLSFAFVVLASTGGAALADQYHVYKLGNGECEIDTRDHAAMKSQRSTDTCLGHFSNRTDAEKQRKAVVGGGQCRCPSGNNC